jgi:hypothetical protein
MHAAQTIWLALAACAFIGFELFRTVRTGRAHAKFGIITRKQSARFRRYVIADCIALAVCSAIALWGAFQQ